MVLEELLKRNLAFVQARAPKPLAPVEALQFAIVSCYDPRLDDLLRPALGLSMESSILLRTAGAIVRAGSDPLRSLGLAIFMFGVTHILVVGHTSCRMAKFDGSGFMDAFGKRGVSREAFGPADLCTWAAAIPDPECGVKSSVAAIRAAPFLPRDVSVSGLVLDDTTGELRVVVQPDETPEA